MLSLCDEFKEIELLKENVDELKDKVKKDKDDELKTLKNQIHQLNQKLATLSQQNTLKQRPSFDESGGGFDGGNLNKYLGMKTVYPKVKDNGEVEIQAVYGNTFYVKVDKNITSIKFTKWPSQTVAQRIVLYFIQDETGNKTINGWEGNVKWPNGNVPTLSISPNAMDILVFETHDSGNIIIGNLVGKNYQ